MYLNGSLTPCYAFSEAGTLDPVVFMVHLTNTASNDRESLYPYTVVIQKFFWQLVHIDKDINDLHNYSVLLVLCSVSRSVFIKGIKLKMSKKSAHVSYK